MEGSGFPDLDKIRVCFIRYTEDLTSFNLTLVHSTITALFSRLPVVLQAPQVLLAPLAFLGHLWHWDPMDQDLLDLLEHQVRMESLGYP